MSLRDWWRKITGGGESAPDARPTQIDEPAAQEPSPSEEDPPASRELSAEERRTLQDEEIL